MTETNEQMLPDKAIRRFDVFAEYTRQERLENGDLDDVAKGYGIWLAKVVASRRFGSKSELQDHKSRQTTDSGQQPKFRSVSDEVQTDEVFDHDIINRMDPKFYSEVFMPAIEDARTKGKSYEDIRDAIRANWKPKKSRR